MEKEITGILLKMGVHYEIALDCAKALKEQLPVLIRQRCLDAVINYPDTQMTAEQVPSIAKSYEKYVLTGEVE